ncbi:hypothetical protein PINS_up010832 [Pythium insidiosum]|nr:hypothetical protein PINS_up010832 [Pythium insidiosum]
MRCVCVLALDQFVDYSADGSVAPVRDLCAQVLGVLLGGLHATELLTEYLLVLRRLLQPPASWHAAHGGLLGVRYLLKAHATHAPSLVPLVLDDVTAALEQHRDREVSEDVAVLAAEILGESARWVVQQTPTLPAGAIAAAAAAQVQRASRALWDVLQPPSESSTTLTGRRSALVATAAIRAIDDWYRAHPAALQDVSVALRRGALTRIAPLLHHDAASVRIAAASSLARLVSSATDEETDDDDDDDAVVVKTLLARVLYQLLVEGAERNDEEEERDEGEENTSAGAVLLESFTAIVWQLDRAQLQTLPLVQWLDLAASTQASAAMLRALFDAHAQDKDKDVAIACRPRLASRVAVADAVGELCAATAAATRSDDPAMDAVVAALRLALQSASGERRCGALLVLTRWARAQARAAAQRPPLPPSLVALVTQQAQADWLTPPAQHQDARPVHLFAEQSRLLSRVHALHAALVSLFDDAVKTPPPAIEAVTAAQRSRTLAEHAADALPYASLARDAFERAHFARQDLFLVDDELQRAFAATHARLQGVGGVAFVALIPTLPRKSGFLVKALMDALKTEPSRVVATRVAQTLARLVLGTSSSTAVTPKVAAKLLSNLSHSAMARVALEPPEKETAGDVDTTTTTTAAAHDDARVRLEIRVRNAELALRTLCEHAAASGVDVLAACPTLRDAVEQAWTAVDAAQIEQHVQLLTLLAAAPAPAVSRRDVLAWLERLATLVQQQSEALANGTTRARVASALASLCAASEDVVENETALALVLERVLLPVDDDNSKTHGAMLTIAQLVARLEPQRLAPIVPALVPLVLRALNASDRVVRPLAARCFAELMPLLPLQRDADATAVSAPRLQALLLSLSSSPSSSTGRGLVSGLLQQGDEVPRVEIDGLLRDGVTLREYQRHGVDWLAFLADHALGGVLADDMGLGKTLQVLTVIARHHRQQQQQHTRSLVVCPPIVVAHWVHEAQRCDASALGDVVDVSARGAVERELRQRRSSSSSSLWITTYAALRRDLALLSSTAFAFAVLDEAHLVRNPQSAVFAAVTALQAAHRVALSGTPVQNHVGDLWALFAFLLPGYLGDWRVFRREVAAPIARARDSRLATAAHKERAALALDALHQRVLPFVLRRTKDDVLSELPPKIISTRRLALSPLQQRLYALATETESDGEEDGDGRLTSVFSTLQTLKKICVAPSLVATQHALVRRLSAAQRRGLLDWRQSGKLVGLRDLLVDECDLGPRDSKEQEEEEEDVAVPQDKHRCLIFAHSKASLDAVAEMLADALPHLTVARLDGSTPSARRQAIVHDFNADARVDVLLLTTAVGGLGLTLTGADTVVFVEHAWNPFVDLQAMDRAHRLGQRRTVRVFRLLMTASLEEHIADLQEFKDRVARSVVQPTHAETSLRTSTQHVLSLLQTSAGVAQAKAQATEALRQQKMRKKATDDTALPKAAREVLEELGEMWDATQYDALAFPEQEE